MKTIVGLITVLVALLTTTALFAVGKVTVFYKDGTSQVYKQIDAVEECYDKRGDLELIRLIPFSSADNEIVIRYEEVKYYQADRLRVDIRKNRHEGRDRDRGKHGDDEVPIYNEADRYGYNNYGYGNFVKMTFAPVFFNDGNGYYRNDRYVYTRTPANFYIDRGWFIDNSTGTIFLGDQNGRGWIYQIVSEINFGKDEEWTEKTNRRR